MKETKRDVALEQRASSTGGMLFSPSAARNKAAIAEAVIPFLKQGARVLELGSGTGEHAEHICALRPDLAWTPSDPDDLSRQSCAARAAAGSGAMRPPLAIDLTQPDWSRGLTGYDAVFCANTIHISPWEAATGLAQGAASLLSPSGVAILYGPFLEGEASTPSNLEFSASLKRRDPRWGVRERAAVEALFQDNGFRAHGRIPMPANNQILVFSRAPT